MRQQVQDRPSTKARKGPKPDSKHGKPPEPTQSALIEGYWQEWTPEDPLPNNGYCTQLYLPAGSFIVNAAAGIHLATDATGPSEVECSLFVGQENRSLNQLVLSPGEAHSIAATAHVESTEATEVQWNCSSTTSPFRLQLAVTAIKVHRLHHYGTPPGV